MRSPRRPAAATVQWPGSHRADILGRRLIDLPRRTRTGRSAGAFASRARVARQRRCDDRVAVREHVHVRRQGCRRSLRSRSLRARASAPPRSLGAHLNRAWRPRSGRGSADLAAAAIGTVVVGATEVVVVVPPPPGTVDGPVGVPTIVVAPAPSDVDGADATVSTALAGDLAPGTGALAGEGWPSTSACTATWNVCASASGSSSIGTPGAIGRSGKGRLSTMISNADSPATCGYCQLTMYRSSLSSVTLTSVGACSCVTASRSERTARRSSPTPARPGRAPAPRSSTRCRPRAPRRCTSSGRVQSSARITTLSTPPTDVWRTL